MKKKLTFSEIYPSNIKLNFLDFVKISTQGERYHLFLLFVFTAILASFEAILFYLMAKIIDLISNSSQENFFNINFDSIIFFVFILLISIIVISLQAIIKYYLLHAKMTVNFKWNLHKVILEKDFDFFSYNSSGKLISYLNFMSNGLRDFYITLIDLISFMIIYFLTLSLILGSFNLIILIPFLVWIFIFILGMIYFLPRLSLSSKLVASNSAELSGLLSDVYSNIKTVKLYSNSKRELNTSHSTFEKTFISNKNYSKYLIKLQVFNHFISVFLIISISGISVYLWSNDILSIGDVAATTAMALRLNGIGQWIMWGTSALSENIGIIKDGLRMISYRNISNNNTKNNDKIFNINKLDNFIQFKDVDFSYSNHAEIFNKFNINLGINKKIGIVGMSGSGKTTLINLLLRLYEPSRGGIYINNVNIKNIDIDTLRKNISVVSQDTSLLNRSVKDNILYGNISASEKDIINASKIANAHDFILELSDNFGNKGYDSILGDHGSNLSGGQRQRISLARAILKNAPILILDEATSALDLHTESIVQDNLSSFFINKTVLIIAHRLSTLNNVDEIFVLSNGSIIESGSPYELINKHDGIYYNLLKLNK